MKPAIIQISLSFLQLIGLNRKSILFILPIQGYRGLLAKRIE